MRVVHISNSVSDSSANTKLHRALLQQGVDSIILVLSHNGYNNKIYDLKRNLFVKILDYVKAKYDEKFHKQVECTSDMPFSLGDIGYPLYKCELLRSADIIHLHWICGILSIKDIKALEKLNKPIVWTCHDSWPFTGGCHVRYGCSRFTQRCGECKMIHSMEKDDLSNYILEKKAKLWKDNNIVLIAPSNWMHDNISNSKIFCNNQVITIPNTLYTNIYKVYDREETKKLLGYEKKDEKINILFGAGNVRVQYKGYQYLLDTLEHLLHEEQYADNIVLHIVGGNQGNDKILSKYECKFWGYVKESWKMAALYNIADIMLYPSLDDNLPNMVMESMACATPVVAFDIGGIPDLIEHKVSGYLAEYRNVEDLLYGLKWIIKNNDDNRIGRKALDKIRNCFSEEKIAQEHIALYSRLLSNK